MFIEMTAGRRERAVGRGAGSHAAERPRRGKRSYQLERDEIRFDSLNLRNSLRILWV